MKKGSSRSMALGFLTLQHLPEPFSLSRGRFSSSSSTRMLQPIARFPSKGLNRKEEGGQRKIKSGTSYLSAHPSNPDKWSSTNSWGPTRNHLRGPKIFGLIFCVGYFHIKAVPLEHSMALDGKITSL